MDTPKSKGSGRSLNKLVTALTSSRTIRRRVSSIFTALHSVNWRKASFISV
jgi:hypothetical protein